MLIAAAEWAPDYGDPHALDPGDEPGQARLCEPWGSYPLASTRSVPPPPGGNLRLAFVDGVRQVEAQLYCSLSTDDPPASGIAGSLGVGAVVPCQSGGLTVTQVHIERLTIVGSDRQAPLPPQPGGWRWEVVSLTDPSPDAPEQALQRRMREQELALALRLVDQGLTVVLDGPLSKGARGSLVGYVKTQHVRVLPEEEHRRVGQLAFGQRSSLFHWSGRYGCYLRLAPQGPGQHPWFAIIRLEAPETLGEAGARSLLEEVGGALSAYAGVAHIDPRAPQNLQAIAGLEKELRRRCGDRALGMRAVRSAVLKWKEQQHG